mmetsp:Transcript_55628/g.178470  ORF Transcript_55628/g.178470 Transcript_55628/m.178470 type:complete len:454 (-) Transcript_55628:28-1389(-)
MVDACEWEQSALLQSYVLGKRDELEQLKEAEDSAAGPRSISPFVPCASSRIPYVLQAARITSEDVLYDLGCGDGILLHEAARRCGCRCVGLDIDAPCLEAARARARELGVDDLCRWLRCDLTSLPEGSLGERTAELAAAAGGGDTPEPPTVALVFLTSSGLVRLANWLHAEWRSSRRSLRIVTCVESLDAAMDYADPGGLFTDANELGWTVCHDHSRWGVFVVPPFGVSLESWRAAGGPPLQLARPEAEATAPALLPGLLAPEELRLVDALGRAHLAAADEAPPSLFDLPEEAAGFHAAAEVALHSLKEHQVLYLHGCEALADEACGLPAIERKLVAAMRANDQWGLLASREVNVRSFEYHVYADGGSVLDPEHRDDGSLLTLSVLLSPPGDFEGGGFVTWQGGQRVQHALGRGDGILFASEKRHNVETVRGDRRALVLELWSGPRNRKSRHS